MITRNDLIDIVLDGVKDMGGEARVVEVARWIWSRHENNLKHSGDLFFTWQYDMRWAAQTLRDRGKLKSVNKKWSIT